MRHMRITEKGYRRFSPDLRKALKERVVALALVEPTLASMGERLREVIAEFTGLDIRKIKPLSGPYISNLMPQYIKVQRSEWKGIRLNHREEKKQVIKRKRVTTKCTTAWQELQNETPNWAVSIDGIEIHRDNLRACLAVAYKLPRDQEYTITKNSESCQNLT